MKAIHIVSAVSIAVLVSTLAIAGGPSGGSGGQGRHIGWTSSAAGGTAGTSGVFYFNPPMPVSPTTINMKCDTSGNSGGGTDQGIITVTLKSDSTSGFQVTTLAGVDPVTGTIDYPTAPKLVPFNDAGCNDPTATDPTSACSDNPLESVPLDSYTFSSSDGVNIDTLALKYKTCRSDLNGLAQIVNQLRLVDNGTINMALVASQKGTSTTPLSLTDLDHAVVQYY